VRRSTVLGRGPVVLDFVGATVALVRELGDSVCVSERERERDLKMGLRSWRRRLWQGILFIADLATTKANGGGKRRPPQPAVHHSYWL
jgi:hypothetical protein